MKLKAKVIIITTDMELIPIMDEKIKKLIQKFVDKHGSDIQVFELKAGDKL